MSQPSPKAVFPDAEKLIGDKKGEARFSVVPKTEPPVCVLYLVRHEDKVVDVVCIRTYRVEKS